MPTPRFVAPTDNDVTVNENALDTTITGSDLAAGTITGSLGTASPAETDATNQLNGSGGFGTLTYALVSGGNAATAGTFGTIQVNADGSYVYTLTSPFTEPTANNGADTVNAAESFTYRVTDANGNTATGTININIVDDVSFEYHSCRGQLAERLRVRNCTIGCRFQYRQ